MKLEALADKIGCSHATLSQWQNGRTEMGNAKVRLLGAFARETGVNLEWLLTGNGPAVSSFPLREHPLVVKAHDVVRDRADLAETALRLLDALTQTSPP